MKNGRRATGIVVLLLVVCVGMLVAMGNGVNDTWHYLMHGDDQITYQNRHFVNPSSVQLESNNLIATGKSYFGEQIYVTRKGDLTNLPAAIYTKKSGQVIEYSLSGGF